jgi:hypothetical protein
MSESFYTKTPEIVYKSPETKKGLGTNFYFLIVGHLLIIFFINSDF